MSNYFSIPSIHSSLEACMLDDDDINLDTYLEAYTELVKFCNLMGNVFGFVRDEIQSKSAILLNLKAKEQKFETLKEMVRYEQDSKLLEKTGYVSGSRTLLRLHWGLNFIRTFLRKVSELDTEAPTNTIAKEVYQETLGIHHVWYVRIGAAAAMWYLPSKKDLVKQVFGKDNVECNVEKIPEMLIVADEVYRRTEQLYKDENLLGLP